MKILSQKTLSKIFEIWICGVPMTIEVEMSRVDGQNEFYVVVDGNGSVQAVSVKPHAVESDNEWLTLSDAGHWERVGSVKFTKEEKANGKWKDTLTVVQWEDSRC